MDKLGWIKLHRRIQDCFLWDDKPYDKARAWIDLLLSAMYEDKKTMINGKVIAVNKGNLITSSVKLSEKWGWSRKKVDSFLKILEDEQMISIKRTAKYTSVTIINYGKYQYGEATQEQQKNSTETTEEATQEQQRNIKRTAEGTHIKNIENIKNYKNIENNTMCKSDALTLFEELWKLYPVKRGKGQVSLAAKQRLLKVGYDEMTRAIDRYKAELEKDNDWRKPQNGSTFFNSGYIDYLDANYEAGDNIGYTRSKNTKDKKPDTYAEEWDRLLNG